VTALAIANPTQSRVAERRRHQRVKVRLPGQFMREDRLEFPCVTIDISPGGIAFETNDTAGVGEKVIAYINQIGRVQGIVTREFHNGFAIAMKLPALKREKLADQLTWLANRHALGMPEDRRHERIVPRNPHTSLILQGGREYIAKIVDVSISGAALSVPVQLPVGTPVTVGSTRAQVVRVFGGGVAVEFARPFSAEEFGDAIRL
jgi:c-di-GMP-binding flagellar brake protein YcgR